jgi:thiamine monophosphate kinase
VGAELTSVPVAPGATLDEALYGGDDYVLVIAAPPGIDLAARFGPDDGAPRYLGRCTRERGECTLSGERFNPRGWEHSL